MNAVMYREYEYCPVCGAVNSMRKRKSNVIGGQRRILARCSVCGAHATIVYREPPSKCEKVPDGDLKF